MPFCHKCLPGEYQPQYNQIYCEKCPENYTSPRGAESLSNCLPKYHQPCIMHPKVCGTFGICVPEQKSPYLYSCLCEDSYVGMPIQTFCFYFYYYNRTKLSKFV